MDIKYVMQLDKNLNCKEKQKKIFCQKKKKVFHDHLILQSRSEEGDVWNLTEVYFIIPSKQPSEDTGESEMHFVCGRAQCCPPALGSELIGVNTPDYFSNLLV